MLVEMDGYDQQMLLTGPNYTLEQLNKIYRHAKKHASSSLEIMQFLCSYYQFSRIPYDATIQVEFVIDTDTGRIYSPTY
ncbi:hypothetical protein MKZ25_08420 [Solibacillus sp. FSL W7-1464]|uniref:hypothetical protein n=1 Tax=Solibacillus sp. FSL W7-1464 TaxID=2921706 RepID=UPI0030FAA3F6